MKKKFFNIVAFFIFIYIDLTSFCFSQGKAILQGHVKQSNGSPLKSSAVLLIQFNPATKNYTVVDTSYTNEDGKYTFDALQQYFILAVPNESFGTELPTYYGDALFGQKAAPVTFNFGDAAIADFATAKKTLNYSGTASIGGTISPGNNNSAASTFTVFLADKNKSPVAVTSTTASGNFQFKNLAYGDYFLWVDFYGVDNTTADAINLNNLNPSKDNQHFQITDGSLNWVENNYASIKEALANKENVFALNLNSIQHDAAEKSMNISPDGTKTLSSQIGEFINLESLSININLLNFLPAETGKLSKLTSLSANLNKLNTLPKEMGNLKNLKSLNLGKNNFSTFPDLITNYYMLKELNFENNPISTLPPTINALKNLKELNLSNCYEITALPIQIGDLVNLETLNLSNCTKIKILPNELNNLKNLKVLDITGTKLSTSSFKKTVPGCEVRKSK